MKDSHTPMEESKTKAGLKKLERDVMPLEAATDTLLKAKTSRERKTAQAARETIWVPDVAEAVDEQIRVIRRLKRGTAAQIVKWVKRTTSRRQKLQADYAKVQEKLINLGNALEKAVENKFETQQKVIESQLKTLGLLKASLDNRARVFDLAWEAIEAAAESKGMKL